jgi:hypothetical protein
MAGGGELKAARRLNLGLGASALAWLGSWATKSYCYFSCLLHLLVREGQKSRGVSLVLPVAMAARLALQWHAAGAIASFGETILAFHLLLHTVKCSEVILACNIFYTWVSLCKRKSGYHLVLV